MRRLIVQEIAKAKGFSMGGLQRAAHLDRNTAQRIWRNPFHRVHPATLEKIAKVLGVFSADLFIEDGENSLEQEEEALASLEPTIPLQSEVTLFEPALTSEEAAQQVRILKALAEPTRLRILSQLSRYERQVSVSELASAYRLAQPTISRHLQILQCAGLISCHKNEQWSYYYLNRENVRKIGEFLIYALLEHKSESSDEIDVRWS